LVLRALPTKFKSEKRFREQRFRKIRFKKIVSKATAKSLLKVLKRLS